MLLETALILTSYSVKCKACISNPYGCIRTWRTRLTIQANPTQLRLLCFDLKLIHLYEIVPLTRQYIYTLSTYHNVDSVAARGHAFVLA